MSSSSFLKKKRKTIKGDEQQKKPPDFRCVCNWDLCKHISERIYFNAPDGHPWKGPSIAWRITKQRSDAAIFKNQICRLGILREFKTTSNNKSLLRVARHHYPLKVWGACSGKSNPPTNTIFPLQKVLEIDALDSKNRLCERVNSVNYLLPFLGDAKPEKNYYEGWYIAAPIQPQGETVKIIEDMVLDKKTPVKEQPPPVQPMQGASIAGAGDTSRSTSGSMVLRKKPKNVSNPERSHVPDPYPTFVQQSKYISYLYTEFYASNEELFKLKSRRTLKDIAGMYQDTSEDQRTIFKLPDKKYLHVCLNSSTACSAGVGKECEMFVILEICIENRKYCNFCNEQKQRLLRHQVTAEKGGEERTSASSKINLQYMSPKSLVKKMRAKNLEVLALRASNRRIKLTLKKANESQMITLDKHQIPDVVSEAFAKVTNKANAEELQKRIIRALLNSKIAKSEQATTAETGNQIEQFAQRMCVLMNAECKKVSGNDKQVRFDSRMMRVALAVFLEDGKHGLAKFRERSLEIVPSLRTVQREYTHFRVRNENHCPFFCAMFNDVLVHLGKTESNSTVQVMFDEIKLKSGVWFNCSTNEIYGFTASKNSRSLVLADEIIGMAEVDYPSSDSEFENEQEEEQGIDEGQEYHAVATYANVFRARSSKNQAHNIAYFLNSGSLDGDTLLQQILHVVTCCEQTIEGILPS